MTLRIYADFHSSTAEGWCWCLRYKSRPLDEVAEDLGVYEGMRVVLFYSDPAEVLECEGVLSRQPAANPKAPSWVALPNISTMRRLPPESAF